MRRREVIYQISSQTNSMASSMITSTPQQGVVRRPDGGLTSSDEKARISVCDQNRKLLSGTTVVSPNRSYFSKLLSQKLAGGTGTMAIKPLGRSYHGGSVGSASSVASAPPSLTTVIEDVEDTSVIILAEDISSSVVSAPAEMALARGTSAAPDPAVMALVQAGSNSSDSQLALPTGCTSEQSKWPKDCYIPFEFDRKRVVQKIDNDGDTEYHLTNRFLGSQYPGMYVHQTPRDGDLLTIGSRTFYIPWEQYIRGEIIKDSNFNRWLRFPYSPQSPEWTLQVSDGPSSALCLAPITPNLSERLQRLATAIGSQVPDSEASSTMTSIADIAADVASITGHATIAAIDMMVAPQALHQSLMVPGPAMTKDYHLSTEQPGIIRQAVNEVTEFAGDVARKVGNVAVGTIAGTAGAEIIRAAIPATFGPDTGDIIQMAAGVASVLAVPTLTSAVCPQRRSTTLIQPIMRGNSPNHRPTTRYSPNRSIRDLRRSGAQDLSAVSNNPLEILRPETRDLLDGESRPIMTESQLFSAIEDDKAEKYKALLDEAELNIQRKEIEIANIKYANQAHIENIANGLFYSPNGAEGTEN